METTAAKVVGPHDGKAGFLGSIGVRFMIGGEEAGERFSLVEHPMSAHALAAPLHRHTREDEYSYILEGRVGALLGDEVVVGGPGDLIFKPRNQWHTFWNAGEEPARLLEIISPAGFERFFAELVDLGGVAGPPRRSWASCAPATSSRWIPTASRGWWSASGSPSPASRSSRRHARRRRAGPAPPPARSSSTGRESGRCPAPPPRGSRPPRASGAGAPA